MVFVPPLRICLHFDLNKKNPDQPAELQQFETQTSFSAVYGTLVNYEREGKKWLRFETL